jgi:lipoyl-dependent peroxiredoxin
VLQWARVLGRAAHVEGLSSPAASNGIGLGLSDGRLAVKLSRSGSHGSGTDPEQLFAAGWSACFISAMELEARKMKVTLPANLYVNAQVDLCNADGAYFIRAPQRQPAGVGRETAQALVDATHQKALPT